MASRLIVRSGLCNNLYFFHLAFQNNSLFLKNNRSLASLNEKLPSNKARRITKKSPAFVFLCAISNTLSETVW